MATSRLRSRTCEPKGDLRVSLRFLSHPARREEMAKAEGGTTSAFPAHLASSPLTPHRCLDTFVRSYAGRDWSALATAERIRFGNPHCPKLFPDLAFRSNSWHSTAETITKLAKIDHPKRTIPCKTRRFSPLRRAKKNFAERQSTRPTPPPPCWTWPVRKPSVRNRTGSNRFERADTTRMLKKPETT